MGCNSLHNVACRNSQSAKKIADKITKGSGLEQGTDDCSCLSVESLTNPRNSLSSSGRVRAIADNTPVKSIACTKSGSGD